MRQSGPLASFDLRDVRRSMLDVVNVAWNSTSTCIASIDEASDFRTCACTRRNVEVKGRKLCPHRDWHVSKIIGCCLEVAG